MVLFYEIPNQVLMNVSSHGHCDHSILLDQANFIKFEAFQINARFSNCLLKQAFKEMMLSIQPQANSRNL